MLPPLTGMRIFLLVWAGQTVSLIGTGITRFALAIWVWDQTHEATALVLMGVIGGVAALLSKFVAGPLIDRWNRRRVMIAADLIAGVCTLVVLFLYSRGALAVWHLYVVAALTAWAGTFQSLAFATSLTLLMPQHQFARARGLMSLSEYASIIGAPLLGGVLYGIIGLMGIFLLDIATFLVAVGTLLLVRIPQPPIRQAAEHVPFWRESLYGFHYIVRRPGLFGLMVITFLISLMEALAYPLITPMLLARTGDEVLLGTVRAVQGLGGIAGGVLLTVWGGPKRRIHGVLIGIVLTGLLGDALLGIGQRLPVWLAAAFFLEFFIPIMLGSYHAIWQASIAPDVQGRVFAARDLMASFGEPITMGLGGVLADRFFEPALMPGGSLAASFGWLVGTGPGAGMGLVMVIGGLFTAIVGVSGYLFRHVREVEAASPETELSVL